MPAEIRGPNGRKPLTHQRTSRPSGACPGRRNVLIKSPSPHTITPGRRLNQRSSGTSGSLSIHCETPRNCSTVISRSIARCVRCRKRVAGRLRRSLGIRFSAIPPAPQLFTIALHLGGIGRVDHLLSDGRQLIRSQRTVARELRQKTLVLRRVEFIDRTAHANVMDWIHLRKGYFASPPAATAFIHREQLAAERGMQFAVFLAFLSPWARRLERRLHLRAPRASLNRTAYKETIRLKHMKHSSWDPHEAKSWANALGLVEVPMFSKARETDQPGHHSVLLDGKAASFGLSFCEEPRDLGDKPLSWSWSADLNNALIVDTKRGEFLIRRWDHPSNIRRFRLPVAAVEAQHVLKLLKREGALKAADVVNFVLRAFRQVRAALENSAAGETVVAFTALLLAVERVQLQLVSKEELLLCRDFNDILKLLDKSGETDKEICDFSAEVRTRPVGNLPHFFLQPVPMTGCRLDPSLLLRHASGRLFQEANLVLERESVEQLHFAGLAPDIPTQGSASRDVRYTPPSLARTLVARAYGILNPHEKKEVVIFDPACGSGVFLVEALREAQALEVDSLRFIGYDISEASCKIARFCLNRAIRESGLQSSRVVVEILHQDALSTEWPRFDVALMNPPFMPWERMSVEERVSVEATIGTASEGRPDKAMAFIWKAVAAIGDNQAVGTVLPAPLLETQSGFKWRENLSGKAHIALIGKFDGFRYFVSSMVEPAFLVFGGRARASDTTKEQTEIVLAKSGYEDEALRGLRLNSDTPTPETVGWEAYRLPTLALKSINWMPRPRAHQSLMSALIGRLPTIGQLFSVHQGIRAGHPCFSISAQEWQSYPKSERVFFRAIATNGTIAEGRIFAGEYIFYPYGASGPVIDTEEDLQRKVKTFYSLKLKPAKAELAERAGIDPAKWWMLTRPRSWQFRAYAKLVSTYFGASGRFAYDHAGEFVVLQGQAWLWKPQTERMRGAVDANEWFTGTQLPFAYLALFNSSVFEDVLGLCCPRVQGGQFDLSSRFVTKLPSPDFSSENTPTDILTALVTIGRCIHAGKSVDVDELAGWAAQAFGTKQGDWQ